MRLKDAEKLARQLMDQHGLQNVSFSFFNNPSICGLANITKNFVKLSRLVVLVNGEKEIRNTILHEIAHILVGDLKYGHGNAWKAKAIEIGCDGTRINKTSNMPRGRFKAVCTVCGRVYYQYNEHRSKCTKKIVQRSEKNIKNLLAGTYDCLLEDGGKIKFVDLKRKLNWVTNKWNRKRGKVTL